MRFKIFVVNPQKPLRIQQILVKNKDVWGERKVHWSVLAKNLGMEHFGEICLFVCLLVSLLCLFCFVLLCFVLFCFVCLFVCLFFCICQCI